MSPKNFLFIFSYLMLTLFNLARAEKLPVAAFASLPDVRNMNLSPNGAFVASLVNVDLKDKKGTVISVLTIETGKQEYVFFTDNIKYTISSMHWANNKSLLINVKYPAARYGTPTDETRLLLLDINSRKSKNILPKSYLKHLKYIPNILTNVVDYLPKDKNHILMAVGGFTYSGEPTVVKVSFNSSGKTRVYQASVSDISSWITDVQHHVRIGIYKDKTKFKIMEQNSSNGTLRELWQFEVFSADAIWPMGFALDPNILYVKALYKGKDAIFKVDLTDPKLTKKLVFYYENYDVGGGLRYSKVSGDVIGVGSHFFDSSYIKFQASLDKALPDTENHLVSLSADERKYIILATNDTEPGVYLLGDRDTNSLGLLAYQYKKLTADVLSEKQTITYKARDGLSIEGFVTLPLHGAKKNLPTVIFPHGGPISFDNGRFDYWTQFFSNQGYAVLQMNFRGSSGYGFDFMKQGLASWGQAMQDDVEDGTRWLIAQGIADKDRICIVGASYGGYAALMGAIKTPDLYQCVVSFAGVTDVEYLVKSSRKYDNFDIVKKQVGSDYDKLWDNSPLKHAKEINKPVLLLHGSKDRTVNVKHSEEMFAALKKAKKNVKYIELDKGDHYLSNNEHRLITFKAMAQFLAENIGSKDHGEK